MTMPAGVSTERKPSIEPDRSAANFRIFIPAAADGLMPQLAASSTAVGGRDREDFVNMASSFRGRSGIVLTLRCEIR
jgi:hypothetical protein